MRRVAATGLALAVAMGVGAEAAACSSSDSSGGAATASDAGATTGDAPVASGDGAASVDGDAALTGSCVDACNAAASTHACPAADGGSLAFDAAKCALACSCASGVMRDDLVVPYGVCIGTPSRCYDGGEDSCVADIAQPYVNDPAVSDFRTACLSRRSECADAGHAFADDYCSQGALLASSVLSTWSACLSEDCANVRTCFDQAFTRPGCN